MLCSYEKAEAVLKADPSIIIKMPLATDQQKNQANDLPVTAAASTSAKVEEQKSDPAEA